MVLELYRTYDRDLTTRVQEELLNLGHKGNFSPNSISVLRKRYFAKDKRGLPQENVEELFSRIASNIAYADFHHTNSEERMRETARQFYEIMLNQEFIPNSPTMMNAGRPMQQLSACFVLPIEDDMGSIFSGIYKTSMVHKSGGGTGFNFSRIRRKNAFVSTTYGKASGPVSFIGAYDEATESVNQGGFRRGANMGIIRIDHPDAIEFIHAKDKADRRNLELLEKFKQKFGEDAPQLRYLETIVVETHQLKNFNISVAITDEFMDAYKKRGFYELKKHDGTPLTRRDIESDLVAEKEELIKKGEVNYRLKDDLVIDANSGEEVGRIEDGIVKINAKTVFEIIARNAWKRGEPGVIFIDEITRHNPTPGLGEIESTNPCG